MNTVLLATEKHRDGTTVDYIFHKDTGRFYAAVHGFAVGQNNSNRVSKLDCNTIYDLQAHLKGKNVKWEPEATKIFPELEESKKMKLTNKEKQLVREYALKLIKESHDIVYLSIDNEKLDNLFHNKFKLKGELDYKKIRGGVVLYCINEDDYARFIDFAVSSGFIYEKDFFEVDKTGQQIWDPGAMEESKKIIKESNTYTMLSALREITDDLLLQTEMMIDEYYGKVDHKEFKNEWYKVSNTFEKKFNQINKNMLSAAKTGK